MQIVKKTSCRMEKIMNFILSRRTLLWSSGTLAFVGSVMGYRHIGHYPTHSLPVKLSNKEVALYQILGNWMLPEGGDLPGSGGDDETLLRIDELLGSVPLGTRELLELLPLAFEHGAALLEWGGGCLTQMDAATQTAYLDHWASSNNTIACQLMASLKAIYGFAYFERADVVKACQLPGLCETFYVD